MSKTAKFGQKTQGILGVNTISKGKDTMSYFRSQIVAPTLILECYEALHAQYPLFINPYTY
jgi:hypothetical protein